MRSSLTTMQSLKVTSAPAIEPVTRAEAKLFARVGWDDEDVIIDRLISRVRRWLEERASHALITQTLQAVFLMPRTPASPLRGIYAPLGAELTFHLPRYPIQSVTTVEIETDLNVWHTLTLTTDYVVDDTRVWLRASAISYWAPTGALLNFSGVSTPRVRVTYVAGYGNGQGAVPESFLSAIMAGVAYLYDNRDAGSPPDSLLSGLEATRNV